MRISLISPFLRGSLVQRKERVLFWYSLAAFMCVATAGVFARVAGNTLFLDRFGADLLPVMYIGTAAIVSIAAFAYGWLVRTNKLIKVIVLGCTALAMVCLATRVVLLHSHGSWRVLAYLVAELVVRFPAIMFWSFVVSLFNPRQGRRLFGLIAASGTVACLLMSVCISLLAGAVGIENLFVVAAALVVGFAALVRGYARSAGESQTPDSRAQISTLRYYLQLFNQRHAFRIAALVVCATIALFLTDFQFMAAASSQYRAEELAAFLAGFYAYANVFVLLIQVFLVHIILVRGGLLLALLLLPVGLLVASTGLAIGGGLPWSIAAKATEFMFSFSVNLAAVQMLYLGIYKQSRSQVRVLVEGFCLPAATVGTSLGLLLAGGTVRPTQVGTFMVFVSVAWIFAAWRARRSYVATLAEAQHKRRLGHLSSEPVLVLGNRELIEQLRRALTTVADDEVPFLMEAAAEVESVDWSGDFRRLLHRQSPEILVPALGYLVTRGNHLDAEAAAALADHADPRVREAALRVFVHLPAADAALRLGQHLCDPVPEVRSTAAIELFNSGCTKERTAAKAVVSSLLESGIHSERIAVIERIDRLRNDDVGEVLARQLEHEQNEEARMAVLRTATRARLGRSLIPGCLSLLADPKLGSAAADTLVSIGTDAVEAVAALGSDPTDSGRYRVPATLARIGGSAALARLLSLLGHDELRMRKAVAEALGGRLTSLLVRTQRKAVRARAEAEISEAAAKGEIVDATSHLLGARVLTEALEEEIWSHVGTAMTLLNCLHDTVDLTLVCRHLKDNDGNRAEAIEILHNLLDKRSWRALLSLIEPQPVQQLRSHPQKHLVELCAQPTSDLVLACALYLIGLNRCDGCSEQVEHYLGHPREIVSGAARFARDSLLSRSIEAHPGDERHADPWAFTLRLRQSIREGVFW